MEKEEKIYPKTTPAIEKKKKKRKIIISLIILLLIGVIICLTLYFTVFKKSKPANDVKIDKGTFYSHKFIDENEGASFIVTNEYNLIGLKSEEIIDKYVCEDNCELLTEQTESKYFIMDKKIISLDDSGKFIINSTKNYDKTEFKDNEFIIFFDINKEHFIYTNIVAKTLSKYEEPNTNSDTIYVSGNNVDIEFSKSSLKNGNIAVSKNKGYYNQNNEYVNYQDFYIYNLQTKKITQEYSVNRAFFYEDLIILYDSNQDTDYINERYEIYNKNLNPIFESYGLYSSRTTDDKLMIVYPVYEDKDNEELDVEEGIGKKRYQLYKLNSSGKVIKESETFIDYYGYHQGYIFLVNEMGELLVIDEDDFKVYDKLENFIYDENKRCDVEYSNELEKHTFNCK